MQTMEIAVMRSDSSVRPILGGGGNEGGSRAVGEKKAQDVMGGGNYLAKGNGDLSEQFRCRKVDHDLLNRN